MNIALWIAQVLLAAMFLPTGFMKATAAMEALEASIEWAEAIPSLLMRFIGLAELAGAIGLVLPAVLRIRPELTIYAALGLLTIMTLAALFHITRGEYMSLPVNLALGALAVFVAWGRKYRQPIPPKGIRPAV